MLLTAIGACTSSIQVTYNLKKASADIETLNVLNTEAEITADTNGYYTVGWLRIDPITDKLFYANSMSEVALSNSVIKDISIVDTLEIFTDTTSIALPTKVMCITLEHTIRKNNTQLTQLYLDVGGL